jgi:hypothetical protein
MNKEEIKKEMIKLIESKLPLGYSRGEGDSDWTIIIEKDKKLITGGYAKDCYDGKRVEDLPLSELGYLIESTKETLEVAREILEDECDMDECDMY